MEPVKPEPKPRGPGRPKAFSGPGTLVSAWIPVSQYNQLCQLAHEHDRTISSVVRTLLITRLK